MSPSGDFSTAASQRESFSLANMVPQAPELNRGIWEGYESAMRHLAQERGELYVITGPLYEGAQLERVGEVLVPSSVYKVVCDPARREAVAVVCENTDAQLCRTISLAEIEQRSGIDFFPSETISASLVLPPAVPHRASHHHL